MSLHAERSRWSARSGVRTNDLEGDEQRRMMVAVKANRSPLDDGGVSWHQDGGQTAQPRSGRSRAERSVACR